jgi:hypothetical protein
LAAGWCALAWMNVAATDIQPSSSDKISQSIYAGNKQLTNA